MSSFFPNFLIYRKKFMKIKEKVIEKTLFFFALTSVIIIFLIFIFLIIEGYPIFDTVSIKDFLLGEIWQPVSEVPKYGILPMILGTLLVTAGAIIIAIPLGVGIAIYLAKVSHPFVREILKPSIEILAGIPSVVLGFFALVVLSPILADAFGTSNGLNALNGAIMLGIMATPTIATISEDSIRAVPNSYEEASLSLGATRWQTIKNVILPASLSGITASVMLGIGRAIGETMVVMMASGNASVIPQSFLDPIRTITSTLGSEIAEVSQGSPHYHALFMMALVLFLMTFIVNLTADYFTRKYREVVE